MRRARYAGLAKTVVLVAVASTALFPLAARAVKLPISAGITSFTPSCSGISVTGHGSDPNRIASSSFSLGVLENDGSVTPVDGTTIAYATPLPREVDATWNSTTALTPGVTYRFLFSIFERDGSSPAAAGGDFTCS